MRLSIIKLRLVLQLGLFLCKCKCLHFFVAFAYARAYNIVINIKRVRKRVWKYIPQNHIDLLIDSLYSPENGGIICLNLKKYLPLA